MSTKTISNTKTMRPPRIYKPIGSLEKLIKLDSRRKSNTNSLFFKPSQ